MYFEVHCMLVKLLTRASLVKLCHVTSRQLIQSACSIGDVRGF